MKRILLFLLLLPCLCCTSAAQNKTYIGLEMALANDLYKIHDNSSYLKSIPLHNFSGGINIRQEISKIIFVETGLLMKYYQQGFGFKPIPYSASSSDDASWLIPLRCGLNVNLFKEKIYFVPVVGYAFGIQPPFGNGFAYGTQESGTVAIHYDYGEDPGSSRCFSLLQTGAGFEFKVGKGLLFNVCASYYTGFNQVTRLNIEYYIENQSSINTGSATSKGEFWAIGTGVKYAISNWWRKS